MRRGPKRELVADVLRERRDALRVAGGVPVLRLEGEDQRLDRLLLRRLQLEVAREGRVVAMKIGTTSSGTTAAPSSRYTHPSPNPSKANGNAPTSNDENLRQHRAVSARRD